MKPDTEQLCGLWHHVTLAVPALRFGVRTGATPTWLQDPTETAAVQTAWSNFRWTDRQWRRSPGTSSRLAPWNDRLTIQLLVTVYSDYTEANAETAGRDFLKKTSFPIFLLLYQHWFARPEQWCHVWCGNHGGLYGVCVGQRIYCQSFSSPNTLSSHYPAGLTSPVSKNSPVWGGDILVGTSRIMSKMCLSLILP